MTINLEQETKLPGVPAIPDDAPQWAQDWFKVIKEYLEVRNGVRGDPIDAGVTFRDLFNAGIGSIVIDGEVFTVNVDPSGLLVGNPSAGQGTVGPPTKPTNIIVTAGLATVILEWDEPTYSGHAYTEIWRSATNDLGTAVRIATVQNPTSVWSDDIGFTGATRYYWIRHVNINGDLGAFHAGPSAGDTTTTGLVGGVDITDLAVTAAKLAAEAVEEGKIKASAVTATKIATAAVGTAAIQNAAITNALIANLAVDSAKIANATITGGKIAASTITGSNIAATTITGGKIAGNTITADKYNELRNSIYVTADDSLDASFPMETLFPILSEMTSIVSIELSFSIQAFRSYSQASSGGGGVVTSTVDSVPGHLHTFTLTDAGYTNPVYYDPDNHRLVAVGASATLTLSTVDGHNHTVSVTSVGGASSQYRTLLADKNNGNILLNTSNSTSSFAVETGYGYVWTSTANGHRHKLIVGGPGETQGTGPYMGITGNSLRSSALTGNQTAETEEAASRHNHTGGTHTHPNQYGIYEETNSPSITVKTSNNGGGSYSTFATGYTTDQLELDLTSSFTGTGWKGVKFESTARCRITMMLVLKLDISA